MVTAGVFLIARCSYFFEFSPFVLKIVVVVGSITAFFAATTGLFQNDMKKVIAYSTCSQLGYMIFACGLSSYEVGLFHLSNHAFFKALLFLGAGSVIHAVADEQDMRKLGGLKKLLPFSYAIMVIGSLALIGFPFLAGFYSKDIILEVSFAKYTVVGYFSFILGTLAAFCTAFYSIRLLFLVFLAEPNGNKVILQNVHEGSWRMTLPLFILSLFSIFIGFICKDQFIGFGTNYWGSAIFVLPYNYLLSDIEFIDIFYKILPLIVTILGASFSYFLYSYQVLNYFLLKKTAIFKWIYTFLNKKWYFDRLYNEFISQNALIFGYTYSFLTVDRGLLERIGPSTITSAASSLTYRMKAIQTGSIFHYLSYILSFIIFAFLLSVKQVLLLVLIYGYFFFTKNSN
jgi:NADH-ubiquinone oxidoreductase chain 5